MELKDKRVLVVGLARTGISAARFLVRAGARVVTNDQKPLSELRDSLSPLDDLPVEIVTGGHPESLFKDAQIVVLSPGVPRDLNVIKLAQEAGAEVISEMELAFRFVSAPVLAVSGTNGKTTTTSILGGMVYRHFQGASFTGGNIGNPLIELPLAGREVKAAVIEVSSFQLEFISNFRPAVGVMLNVTDDHLDRYRGMADYAAVKLDLFRNQTGDDVAVLNADDPITRDMAARIKSRVLWFGLEQPRKPGVIFLEQENSLIFSDFAGREERVSLERMKLVGVHNLMNVMAACAAALSFGVSRAVVQEVVDGFTGLHHRIEFVRELHGVRYYNDSKATNPGAVLMSLKSFKQPVILLMGNQAKGCHFDSLAPLVRERVKIILAFGEAKSQIREELGRAGRIELTENMSEALARARALASPGDVVLLAPGGASFDQFRDYKERGELFRKQVESFS